MKTLAGMLLFVFCASWICATPVCAQQDRKALMAEYARRYKAIDKKNVDQMLELAEWCRSKKLKTYANLLFRKVLKRDPQNDRANAGMGRVKVGDRWFEPEEAEKERARLVAEAKAKEAAAASAAAKKAAGVDEEGARAKVSESIGKNEGDAAKLLEEYLTATGAVEARHCSAISDHVVVVARAVPAAFAPHFAQIAEYVYRRLNKLTFGKDEMRTFAKFGGRMKFFLVNDPSLEPAMDFLQKKYPDSTRYNDYKEAIADIRKNELEFTSMHWPPMHVHLNEKNQSSAVANAMARSWMEHNSKMWFAEPNITGGKPKDYTMMSWMLEGLGVWASLDAVGSNRLFRTEKARYANQKKEEKDVELNYPGIAYEIATTGQSEGRDARSFYQLCRARLHTWHTLDLSMAYSFVDFLIRERPDDWRKLVALVKQQRTFRGAFIELYGTAGEKKKARDVLARTHRDLDLEKVFRDVAKRFEADWKTWAKGAYEEIRDDPEHFKQDAPFVDEPKKK